MSFSEGVVVSIHEAVDGEMPPLQAEWQQCLAGSAAHERLFTFEWYAAWTRTFTHPACREDPRWTGTTRVLVARRGDGVVVGILPLALARLKGGIRCWSLAGCQSPLRSFPCASSDIDATCKALAAATLRMLGWRDILRIGPYGPDTPARAAFMRELQEQSRTALTFDLYRRVVVRNVPQTPEELKALVKARSSFQRVAGYERKLAREGRVEFVHYRDPEPARLRELMAECKAIEEASWLMQSSWPNFNFARGGDARFWPVVSETSLVPNGQFDLWIAYFNDQAVALRFALTAGDRRYAIANQYDEKFSQYGLGWVLYLRDMTDCCARGVTEIDMAMGNDDYKKRWGGEDGTVEVECIVLPPNPIGRIAAAILKLPPIYRRIDRRVPGR